LLRRSFASRREPGQAERDLGLRGGQTLDQSAEPSGWQLVYGLALPAPRRAAVRELSVLVDGQPLKVELNGTIYPVTLAR